MKEAKKKNKMHIAGNAGAGMRLFLLLFSMIMLAGGCGSKQEKAPELLDPVQGTVAFRPVTKKLVGFEKRLSGHVVPEEHPVYSEKGCEVTSVLVAIGDYVSQGDLIAVADKDGLDEEIRQINARIASLEREREKTLRIYDQTFGLLNFKKETEDAIGANDYAQILKDEQMEQENLRYELAVIDEKIGAERELIGQTRERLKKTEFFAPCNGYITYLKDFSDQNFVGGFENVAVVSDYNDRHIEVPDVKINKYDFADYQNKWVELEGKRIPIEEYDYTVSEAAYAKAASQYPCMRFKLPDDRLKVGESVILHFKNGPIEDTLAVGNDSLYRDGLDAYVYVRINENGDTEKRNVTVGEADEYYTQITSGLTEGEEVLYNSNEYVPKDRDSYETVIRTYTENSSAKNIFLARPYYDIYTVPHDGRLVEKTSASGVEEGEELFTVSYSGGDAQIEAAAVAIDDLNSNHQIFLKDYEKNKKELDRSLNSLMERERMIGAKKDMDPSAEDIETLRSQMNAEAEVRAALGKLEIEREYEQKEYEAQSAKLREDLVQVKKQSGGSHDIIVKAKNAGKPTSIEITNDSPVSKGQFLLSVQKYGPQASRSKLFCKRAPTDGYGSNAIIGAEVTFITEDKIKYPGHCIGTNPGEDKNYLFTKDGEEILTYSSPYSGSIKDQFYVELDDKIDENLLFKAELQYVAENYPFAVTVPATSVFEEYSMIRNELKKFVWKIENGTPVKEYVEILETDSPKQSVLILRGVSEGDMVLQ